MTFPVFWNMLLSSIMMGCIITLQLPPTMFAKKTYTIKWKTVWNSQERWCNCEINRRYYNMFSYCFAQSIASSFRKVSNKSIVTFPAVYFQLSLNTVESLEFCFDYNGKEKKTDEKFHNYWMNQKMSKDRSTQDANNDVEVDCISKMSDRWYLRWIS